MEGGDRYRDGFCARRKTELVKKAADDGKQRAGGKAGDEPGRTEDRVDIFRAGQKCERSCSERPRNMGKWRMIKLVPV